MKKIIVSAVIGLMLTATTANAQEGGMMGDMPPPMDGQQKMKKPEMPSPEKMFKKLDIDGNGCVSFEEFKTHQVKMQKIREERMKKMKEMKEMRSKMRKRKSGMFGSE